MKDDSGSSEAANPRRAKASGQRTSAQQEKAESGEASKSTGRDGPTTAGPTASTKTSNAQHQASPKASDKGTDSPGGQTSPKLKTHDQAGTAQKSR